MIHPTEGGFDLLLAGRLLLRHRPDAPCLSVGRGTPSVAMHRGNFALSDHLHERLPLRHATVAGPRVTFRADEGGPPVLTLELSGTGADAQLRLAATSPGLNRLWLRLHAEPDEHVWGGGEQMSYLALRGRRFPLWTSEPGVGRDKSTAVTQRADAEGQAGGDYWTTNYPQPTFLSSRRYALHLDTTAYSVLDFTDPAVHELEVWEIPARVELWCRPDLPSLVGTLARRFGMPRPLPAWTHAGAILGLKDGERSFARLEAMLAAGVRVSALWCEDWSGLRHTSFGARLFWDWRADPRRYPDLPARIAALRARGIRFLGYVNPYLCDDGTLFPEAAASGFLALAADGTPARVDFGEFHCGVVDFTAPGAAAWFARRVIRREMLGIGLSGWMADFGEYLPTDIRLAQGDPMLLHNAWPVLWAAVNARAVGKQASKQASASFLKKRSKKLLSDLHWTRPTFRAKRTKVFLLLFLQKKKVLSSFLLPAPDALFFMRAGYTGLGAHCPLLWGGDQSVDWTRHDGLPSALCGALSSGLLGNAFHHSDIGGYTSLYGVTRTPELLIRWAEMAVFTPLMRTHEGNRPRDNVQVDHPDVLPHFARCTRLWVALVPYHRAVAAEAAATGLPAQRPLFLCFEHDPACATLQDSFLYGPDLLVAPVLHPGATSRTAYLPAGKTWTHLWTGQTFPGGAAAEVPAPPGRPPVFVRAGSVHQALFEGLRRVA